LTNRPIDKWGITAAAEGLAAALNECNVVLSVALIVLMFPLV
jgi:hypothetical protein